MWRARPVFVSSTFQDMQAERDHLRNFVFPELEERLRKRRHHLEWVDLRVGVATASLAEEQARELRVLKVCLAEVRRCRPFLIVLLGDRYGWVPPPERIRAVAAEEGFSADVAGRSVTDLEIEFGIFADPEQQPRSVFYFREPLPYAEMPPATAALYSDVHDADPAMAHRARRLATLKQRIGSVLPSRVHHYAAVWDRNRQRVIGLEQWGRMVLEDIWAELDAETAAAASEAEPSWQQVERNALDDFAEDRARDFVGRRQVLAQLTDLALSPAGTGATWGSCVTGEAGSGKSALFGELYRRLQQPDALVLAHAAGASVQAASVDSMLRRWIEELAAALGTGPGLPENADLDTVEATFASLLTRGAHQRRVIVLLDALEQFETTTRGRYVTWLPRQWPANARFIATAIPGDASQALSERSGVALQPLPPLDAGEARGIIEAVCARYHRAFEPQITDALVAKTGRAGPAWGNPLWLVLAVEELNLLDADDFARADRSYFGSAFERLRGLMMDIIAMLPTDIAGLYNASFDRAAELFGDGIAWAFLGLIAASRAGWRESDFQALLPPMAGEPWDELRFASLRRLFRGQMRQRGALAQWDFSHTQMRAAMQGRLLSRGVVESQLHRAIADHLLALSPDDPLRRQETMFHLLESGDWTRAASYYGDPELSKSELEGATLSLASAMPLRQADGGAAASGPLIKVLHAPGVTGTAEAQLAERFLGPLWSAVKNHAAVDSLIGLAIEIRLTFTLLSRANPNNARLLARLSESHEIVGDVLTSLGKLEDAESSYRNSLEVSERLVKLEPTNPDWNRELAASHYKIGNTRIARGDVNGAEPSANAALAIRKRLVDVEPDDTSLLQELSWSHDQVGQVKERRGDLKGAEASFMSSLSIAERLANRDPANTNWQNDLSASYHKLADLQVAEDDLQGAEQSTRLALSIARRISDRDPGNTILQRERSVSLNRLGDVQLARGDAAGAEVSYDTAMQIVQRLATRDSKNVGLQRDLIYSLRRIGRSQVAKGDLPRAEASYRAAIDVRDQLDNAELGHADWMKELASECNKTGEGQMQRGDTEGAARSYQSAVALWTRVAAADPTNAAWRRGIAGAHQGLGIVSHARGDRAGMEDSFRAAIAIVEQLLKDAPDNIEAERELALLSWSQSRLYKMWNMRDELWDYRSRAVSILQSLQSRHVALDQKTNELLDYLDWGGD